MGNSNFINGVTKFWWIPLLTGLIFIGFGVWCLCSPVASLTILAYIFAGFIGAAGLFNLLYGFSNVSSNHGWGWAVASGIIEILCSVWLFFLPSQVLTSAFIFAIGIYIIFVGINAICESVMINRFAPFWLLWILALLLVSIFCACVFLVAPVMGGVTVWLYIGISFICYGVYRIMLSLKMKRINKTFSN